MKQSPGKKVTVAEQLEVNDENSRDMIDRAIDTINFTAKNGMELAREGA